MITEERLTRPSLTCSNAAELERVAMVDGVRMIGSLCIFDQDVMDAGTLNGVRLETARASETMPAEEALDRIYPPSHEACATKSLIAENEVARKVGNSQFAVIAIEGCDPRSVAARRNEAKWFHAEFGTHPSEHEEAFSKYSDSSLFLHMFDMSDPDNPLSCGVLRFIRPSEAGLKTVNILSHDEMAGDKVVNPWFNDFVEKIPEYKDATEAERVKLIYEFFGIDQSNSWDVPTMAVDARYKGHDAEAVTPAWGLYVACVNVAMDMGCNSFINTQDVAPLRLMQFRFARLWTDGKTPDEQGKKGKYGFSEVPYEGPAPVVPTCLPDIAAFRERILRDKPNAGRLLFDRESFGSIFKIPEDIQPEMFHTPSAA